MFTTTTKGYSLVETMVAISVLLIAMVGPMTIAAKSILTSRYIEETTTALFLAQEGIEAVVWARNEETLFKLLQINDDPNRTPASQTWEWVGDSRYGECFSSNGGCNVTFNNDNPNEDPFYDVNEIYDCSTLSNCGLSVTDVTTARGKYVHDAGGDADFYRVIEFDNDTANNQLTVNVEVFWNSDIFETQRSVVLQTVLFDIYGE